MNVKHVRKLASSQGGEEDLVAQLFKISKIVIHERNEDPVDKD